MRAADPRPRRPQRSRRTKDRLRAGLPALLRGLSALFGILPWGIAQRAGRALGTIGWHLARRDRGRALEHLAIAFPDLPERERHHLARDSFRHQGTNLGECLHLLHRDCAAVANHVVIEGWEEIERVRAAGRPLVLITGHCGNWELLGAAVNCRGLGMAVVARALDQPGLQALLAGLRARFGTPTIERGGAGATRQLLAVLRQGGALGMLIDQDTKVDGVWVPFFGRPAFTPVGAAKIALRQKAAVLPVFIARRPDGSHLARFQPPLDLSEDPVEATAQMTAAIEAQIRRHPEQWVWMHRRWRTQPPAPSHE